MKQLLFTSLMFVGGVGLMECQSSFYQDKQIGYLTDTTWYVGKAWQRVLDSANQRDEFIMMEIVSIKKPGLHFFKKGYKRGDKYWYFDGRRVKPLPKNWMVWEYREIKD